MQPALKSEKNDAEIFKIINTKDTISRSFSGIVGPLKHSL